MATITIQLETKHENSWTYQVKLTDNSSEHEYNVTLSQPDYQMWSPNQGPPSAVVKAAFEFLLEREPATSILAKFDCAIIRRYFPEVDRELPKKLA